MGLKERRRGLKGMRERTELGEAGFTGGGTWVGSGGCLFSDLHFSQPESTQLPAGWGGGSAPRVWVHTHTHKNLLTTFTTHSCTETFSKTTKCEMNKNCCPSISHQKQAFAMQLCDIGLLKYHCTVVQTSSIYFPTPETMRCNSMIMLPRTLNKNSNRD